MSLPGDGRQVVNQTDGTVVLPIGVSNPFVGARNWNKSDCVSDSRHPQENHSLADGLSATIPPAKIWAAHSSNIEAQIMWLKRYMGAEWAFEALVWTVTNEVNKWRNRERHDAQVD